MAGRKKKKPQTTKKATKSGARSFADAAAALSKARAERGNARSKLARLSRAGDPHHIVAPAFAWIGAELRRVRGRLIKLPGVVGVGLGQRVQDGILADEPCITVLVQKKIPLAELRASGQRPLPKLLRVGKRKLHVDVVQLGALERQLTIGANIGPVISRNLGTLGAFARDTIDNSSVAVTAMHVSGAPELAADSGTVIPFCSPSRFVANSGGVFGDLVRGTTTTVDAAKLRLRIPQPAGGFFPGLGPIAGWRPVVFPGDIRTTVFMFGAISGLQQGFITNTSVDLPADRLEDTIIVNIPSAPGDSGAALVDSQRFLLGFLVGAGNASLGNLRVFCPAGLTFSKIACDIP